MVLEHLTFIAIALVLGLLASLIAVKLKLPKVLIITIVGIFFGYIIRGENLALGLPPEFISGISIFALILIIFESTAKIRFRELDEASISALKVTFVTVLFNIIVFIPATLFILYNANATYIFLSALFGTIMAGTSPDVVLAILAKSRKRIIEVLKIESIINTPLTVILPYLMIELQQGYNIGFVSTFVAKFVVQITSGIGSGIAVGLVLFKIMRKSYSDTFSPIAVIGGTLMAYIIAENIGGSGILAVASMGLFFGNLYIKQKVALLEFETIFSDLLRILIFILLGVLIELPAKISFYLIALALFITYTVIRFLSIKLFFKQNLKETLFMSLTAAKGIAVVVITLTIIALNIPGFEDLKKYIFIFILISMIVSSVTARFAHFFLGVEVEEEFEKVADETKAMPTKNHNTKRRKKSKK